MRLPPPNTSGALTPAMPPRPARRPCDGHREIVDVTAARIATLRRPGRRACWKSWKLVVQDVARAGAMPSLTAEPSATARHSRMIVGARAHPGALTWMSRRDR